VDEFYRHPRMADGRLGKCKACTKTDVRRWYWSTRPARAEYERSRANLPHRRALSRKNRQKSEARIAVNNAIRDGRLVRQPCQVCGVTARVEAHHDDYSRPLDVRWLCFTHHCEVHGKVPIDGHVRLTT